MAEPPSDTRPGDKLPGTETARTAALALLLSADERAMLERAARLSGQERAVFLLIGAGLKPKAVASDLALSVKTVETIVERIRSKLSSGDGKSIGTGDLAFVARLWSRANDPLWGIS